VAVASDSEPPDLLLVLKLHSNAGFDEIYNGPFPLELWLSKKANKRRTKILRVSELRPINPKLLKQQHPLDRLNKLFKTT
jgi:hypothetical protein